MPIIASSNGGGSFTPHPEGQYPTICADVHDLGMMEVTWEGVKKRQHKIDIYFFCGEFVEKEGKKIPLMVRDRFTLSLNEASKLRPFLESWRGKKFTPEEEGGFDVERLILAPAFIQVSHNETPKGVFANIDTIMKLPKGMPVPEIPVDFVRLCFREPKPAAVGAAASSGPSYDDYPTADYPEDDSDSLPF